MKFSIKTLLTLLHISLVCFMGQIFCDVCPAPATIQPCICNSKDSQITCSGDKSFDLKQIFSIISANGGKHFDEFILSNSAITILEDNVFSDVSFRKFQITGAYNLSKVSRLALNASSRSLEEFRQMGENQMTDTNVIELFEALSSLVSVNRIYLELTKVTKVPDNAFKIINGRQTNLESIHLNYIGGKFGSLETIGSKPFYYLDNLKYLSIANQPIKHLSAQAFDFERNSTNDLDIHLEATKITGSTFEAGIFLNANRPMTIEMSRNNIEYLDEKVFKPVFALPDSQGVTLILEENPLECDCRMQWMLKDKDELKYRVMGPTCAHTGKELWDLTQNDFIKCHV